MLGVLLVIGAAAIWALDTLIRYPMLFGGVSAERIVFSEHLLLTVIFLPVFIKYFNVFKNCKKRHWLYFLIIGGLGSAYATLAFTKALYLINPSLVILLQKLQPMVAIMLARLFIKERVGWKFVMLAMMCIVGGFLISYEDIFPGLMDLDFSSKLLDEGHLLGYGLTLFAVFGWGAATVFGKKLGNSGFKEKEIMTGRFMTGFVCLFPLLFFPGIKFDVNPDIWGKIVLMVLFTGMLSMYLYYQGLKRIPARVCTIAEMFFPLLAVTVNWIFLDAKLTIVQIVGAFILVAGSTVIQFRRY